jgi:hypothetical protein
MIGEAGKSTTHPRCQKIGLIGLHRSFVFPHWCIDWHRADPGFVSAQPELPTAGARGVQVEGTSEVVSDPEVPDWRCEPAARKGSLRSRATQADCLGSIVKVASTKKKRGPCFPFPRLISDLAGGKRGHCSLGGH